MTKAVKELLQAAEVAAEWMEAATLPNEPNSDLRRLQSAIKQVKDGEKTGIRTGYLHLIELADGRRRVTATVESRENYFSRAGWSPAGINADIIYSEEVNDLTWARGDLRTLLPDERWSGQGMQWSESPKEELIAAMQAVAESVNR